MNTVDPQDNAGVLAPPPLLFLACVSAGALLHHYYPVRLMDRQFAWWMGGTLACVAGVLAAWAMLVMRASGTNIRPDRPVLAVVSTGPYKFTRNPMYLSLCLLEASTGFFLNDWMPFLFVLPLALLLHFGVVLREERYLEKKFGVQYLTLKRRVHRWI